MSTRIIDYQRWKGLTGDDKRIYQMVSGIYGAMGDMGFRVNQYSKETLTLVESLYYNVTVRDICVISINQISSYQQEKPNKDTIIEMLDLAINIAKKAILVVKNNTYVEELLALNTLLNGVRDTIGKDENVKLSTTDWELLKTVYLKQVKDTGTT